ncbi:hypothetical protein SAMN05421805_116138 [Saccharopolyspora antimicrobica]|uniref:Uncharacterized protein n=1 Tax=Saccharopolyspora antimicrobica TaxID=455193 RepID=A0A1I5HVI4_9PSEU|nr:hypothetical protein SAMN05421805_116138 [Saccharopolyspora antimicrobica]
MHRRGYGGPPLGGSLGEDGPSAVYRAYIRRGTRSPGKHSGSATRTATQTSHQQASQAGGLSQDGLSSFWISGLSTFSLVIRVEPVSVSGAGFGSPRISATAAFTAA